jgi:hypothetical protein
MRSTPIAFYRCPNGFAGRRRPARPTSPASHTSPPATVARSEPGRPREIATETWWIYEMPSAQAAFDAVLAVGRRYRPEEITGLAVVSREGPDDCDHLFICATSKMPPNDRIDSVAEFLKGFGLRGRITLYDLNGPGIHFLASGPTKVILGLLLRYYPGEIELRWPEAGPRLYRAG